MKKTIAVACLLLTLAACKTKQAVVVEEGADEARTVREIVDGHYKNEKGFKTLKISAGVSYKDNKQSQNLSAEIRLMKDEIILVSLRFLGITMAKAYITPKKVSYYEKLNGTYFDGDYAALSKWLGTDLDFGKVQNMLLGEAIYNLKDGTFKASIDKEKYKLQGSRNGMNLQFFFEGANYLIKEQLISQGGQQPRSLDIKYPAHTEHPKAILPAEIKIEAEQKERVTIAIDYNNVTFDDKLTYPYSVPEGFEQVFID